MATVKEEGAVPDFLRMDQPVSSDPANAKKTGSWHGWPTKEVNPVILTDDEGRTVRIRTPVMGLEGLITPTNLHYAVQHFAVPPVVETEAWELDIVGEVKSRLTLNCLGSVGSLAELAFFRSASKLACAPSDVVPSSAASATVLVVRTNKAKALLNSRIASLHRF
jgi:hypothetical protein